MRCYEGNGLAEDYLSAITYLSLAYRHISFINASSECVKLADSVGLISSWLSVLVYQTESAKEHMFGLPTNPTY